MIKNVRDLTPGDVFVSSDFNSQDEPLRYRVTGCPRIPRQGASIVAVPAVPAAHLTDDDTQPYWFTIDETVEVDPK